MQRNGEGEVAVCCACSRNHGDCNCACLKIHTNKVVEEKKRRKYSFWEQTASPRRRQGLQKNTSNSKSVFLNLEINFLIRENKHAVLIRKLPTGNENL